MFGVSQNVNHQKDNFVQLSSWEFRQTGTVKWHPAIVPGTVHTDLLANNLIKDPFYRTNENELQWIDKVNWEYRTSFNLSENEINGSTPYLVFEGLDTYADVYLNDQLVHSNNNMFVKSEISLADVNLKKDNELVIRFKSPVITGLSELEEYGLPLPADNDQSIKGGMGDNRISVFTRKAPYHYGWDWGPRLVTSGIWRNAYIQFVDKASIENIYIRQKSLDDKVASLEAEIEIKIIKPSQLKVEILSDGKVLNSQNVSTTQSEQPALDNSTIKLPFSISNPRLWWTNGHGSPHLYDFEIRIYDADKLLDKEIIRTGLRNIKLVRKPDKQGESFYFEVNGKPIFAKGANYIPNDVFLTRVTPEKYEDIISAAAEANMNMLRVWGGGFYENDIFYDLCDKYGIMVWQDFMFACAMYPGNREFLEEITQEAEYNIKRLRNHPCMALWCGNNEIEIAWAEYEEPRGWGWKQRYTNEERKKIWQAYDTVFHKILPEQVKMFAPETEYWHSSPSAGIGKLASHINNSGDMHYWGVWHGNEPIKNFSEYKARFMSEYGFQSFPEFESIKKFTEPSDWYLNSEVLNAHQRSYIGNGRIKEYMSEYYFVPEQFEDFLYVGQLLQAEAIKNAIESHRSDMPYCMGSLYWQLNDCWPAASWSSIDYYGRWKALHYSVKESFKNQIVRVNVADDKIQIYGISDVNGGQVSLRVNLMDFNGTSIWNRSYSVKMPDNSAKKLVEIELDNIPAMKNSKTSLLFVSIVRNEKVIDSDIYYFEPVKNLKLPFVNVHIHIREKTGKYELEITSDKLCKNLMLISEDNAYEFSDNFFDLLPGETKVVEVLSDLPYSEFERRLSYIHMYQVVHN
jgi:beta-mannosidase